MPNTVTSTTRLTPEREAEIRAALRTGRKAVSYVFIGRDLLDELDAVRAELQEARKDTARLDMLDIDNGRLIAPSTSFAGRPWACLDHAYMTLRSAIDHLMESGSSGSAASNENEKQEAWFEDVTVDEISEPMPDDDEGRPYRCGCFVSGTGELCLLESDHAGPHQFASDEEPERRFPVMQSQWRNEDRHLIESCPDGIPWGLIARHEAQLQRNHYQSAERLSQRGGLTPQELYYILRDERWPNGAVISMADAIAALCKCVESYRA